MAIVGIGDLSKHEGKEATVRGWVYRERAGKGIRFLVVRDVSGVVQCVLKEGHKDFQKSLGLQVEASVIVTGKVRKDERSPGGYEVEVQGLEVVGESDKFPITKDQSTEHLLDVRHLWVRSRRLTAIFKIRSTVFGAIHEFFRSRGFFESQSPIFTSSACEGGSTLFEVKYFDEKAYLAQSWQLYAEAMVASLEKIYCIAPSFRAEKSRTRRHLVEYWHAEAEAAWMQLDESLKLQEGLVAFVVKKVLEERKQELAELGRDTKLLDKVKPPFARITYKEALETLNKKGFALKWGADFGVPEERVLTEGFDRPFFVTRYPTGTKAFYMKVDPKDPKVVLCADMLAPEGYGEIIGGSERETDIKVLVKMLKAQGEDPKNYEWYLDTRRYGSVPHSGFGLGVERLIMWITGIDHIRDTIAFPRTITRLKP